MPRYQTVLFDLDGTLVDSAPGITQTIAYTLRELGGAADVGALALGGAPVA